MHRALSILPVVLLAACGRPDEDGLRRYREISIPAPARDDAAAQPAAGPSAGDMLAPGAAGVAPTPTSLAWTTPDGWTEHRENPMRIVTFLVGADRAECAITAFPGAVGGIEGNLERWAGQIQVALPPETLARFARGPETFKTDGGLSCLLYDFGTVAPAADPTVLAAILPMDDRTLFVKFTGPASLLAEQKDAFRALCRSLRP